MRNLKFALVALCSCSSYGVAENHVFNSPGDYDVVQGDVFIGPMGASFKISEISERGAVLGRYVNTRSGDLLGNALFAESKWPIAHYGINLVSYEPGVLTLEDSEEPIKQRCVDLGGGSRCGMAVPTEAVGDEEFVYYHEGFYGKTNRSAEIAECYAKNISSMASYTSEVFGTSLAEGSAYMALFGNGDGATGVTVQSVAAWFPSVNSAEDEESRCRKMFASGFSKSGHELVHLFTWTYEIPYTLNEGIAHFLPNYSLGYGTGWEGKYKFCHEGCFGSPCTPYIHYNRKVASAGAMSSGSCFWGALVKRRSTRVLGDIMRTLDNLSGSHLSFELKLQIAGIDTSLYQQWGFVGERK